MFDGALDMMFAFISNEPRMSMLLLPLFQCEVDEFILQCILRYYSLITCFILQLFFSDFDVHALALSGCTYIYSLGGGWGLGVCKVKDHLTLS